MVVLSDNENTYNAELTPKAEEAAQVASQNYYVGVDDYSIFPDAGAQQYNSYQSSPAQVVPSYSQLLTENLVSKTPSIPKAQVTFGKKVLSLDDPSPFVISCGQIQTECFATVTPSRFSVCE